MITVFAVLSLVRLSAALCGASVRGSHHFNVDDVYGTWYGVAYAQHSPDLTDRPDEIGCITLHIGDTDDVREGWLDWTIPRRNYSNQNWLSRRNNPFSSTRVAGSWLDVRLKRSIKRRVQYSQQTNKNLLKVREKRDSYRDRKLRVLWDEDGQSMEQNYVYSTETPGLWTVEQWRPMERELTSRGIDVWYPDDPPRHPDVIRVLRVSPQELVINHCSDLGKGGIFTLILRRSPAKVNYWEWYDYQREFYAYDLPNIHRKAAVCAACSHSYTFSLTSLVIYVILSIFNTLK